MSNNIRFFPFRFSHNDPARSRQLMRRGAAAQADEGSDSTPIDQQLADAFNSNNAVMAYVLGLTNTNLPALAPEPSWYADFATQFSNAKTNALEWQNGITPSLTSIPANIVSYASIFSALMVTINQAITLLSTDPNNAGAMATLTSSLQSLVTATQSQSTAAQATQTQIDAFSASLTSDAAVMQQAITDALNTAGADQDQIDQLASDVAALQDKISEYQAIVTASAIGAGVALFAGFVIAFFSFGVGIAIGIIGFAAGLTTALVLDHEIDELNQQVQNDQAQMTDLNNQIAALTVLQANLQTLISLSNDASTQVQLLSEAWAQLETEITAVITDLEQAELDVDNLTALQADLNAANADWQTLQSFATTMAGIQYNTATPPTASLPSGTTSSAVAA